MRLQRISKERELGNKVIKRGKCRSHWILDTFSVFWLSWGGQGVGNKDLSQGFEQERHGLTYLLKGFLWLLC